MRPMHPIVYIQCLQDIAKLWSDEITMWSVAEAPPEVVYVARRLRH